VDRWHTPHLELPEVLAYRPTGEEAEGSQQGLHLSRPDERSRTHQFAAVCAVVPTCTSKAGPEEERVLQPKGNWSDLSRGQELGWLFPIVVLGVPLVYYLVIALLEAI